MARSGHEAASSPTASMTPEASSVAVWSRAETYVGSRLECAAALLVMAPRRSMLHALTSLTSGKWGWY